MSLPYLLCYDGKHRKLDAVEFIKAAPKPRLTQSLEDFCHVRVSLLVGAVSYNLPRRITRATRAHDQRCGGRIILVGGRGDRQRSQGEKQRVTAFVVLLLYLHFGTYHEISE